MDFRDHKRKGGPEGMSRSSSVVMPCEGGENFGRHAPKLLTQSSVFTPRQTATTFDSPTAASPSYSLHLFYSV